MTLSGQTVVLEVVTSLHLKIINPYPNHSLNRCGGKKRQSAWLLIFWSIVVFWPCGLAREWWSRVGSLGISLWSLSRALWDQELHSCWQICRFWSRPILLPVLVQTKAITILALALWPYVTWRLSLSTTHTDAASFDGLDCCVRVCGVSCWLPRVENFALCDKQH